MSFESWAGSAEAPVQCRLPTCGHTIKLSAPVDSTFECPTCGDERPEQSGLATRDYVPTADLTWQGATCRKLTRPQLKPLNVDGAGIAAIEDLVAALSSPKVHRLRLRTASLPPKSPFLAPRGNSFAVWRAVTVGCSVNAGVVELPERGLLLLAGAGAHFHGTTFTGGNIMCAGPQYSGTFEDCTFHATSVYLVHGAAAVIRRSVFRHAHIGLTLSGGATSATLTDCTFRRCRAGIVAEAGAELAMSGCDLLRTEFAITLNEAGCHAALERCDVRGGFDAHDPLGEAGVTVRHGVATLRNCQLTSFYNGFHATHSRVELQGVQIADSVGGVCMRRHTHAVMRESSVEMSIPSPRRPVAIAACGGAGSGGRVFLQLERCTVRECGAAASAVALTRSSTAAATLCRFSASSNLAAIEIVSGSHATLAHCTCESQEPCLVVASPDGRLRVQGGVYKGATTACIMQLGSQLTATGCEFRSQDGPREHGGHSFAEFGVVTLVDAQGRLSGCSVHGGIIGVLMCEATVSAVNVCVNGAQSRFPPAFCRSEQRSQIGVSSGGAGYLCVSSRLTVRGGSVRRCVIGVESGTAGVEADYVTLDGVHVTDCVFGADFSHPGRADLVGCVFQGLQEGRQGDPGLVALLRTAQVRNNTNQCCGVSLRCRHASVQRCSVSGFSDGVSVAEDVTAVSIQHCNVAVLNAGGMGVLVAGKVAIEDSKVHSTGDKHQSGIVAVDAAKCDVRRCRFQGAALAAIDAQDDACVSVLDSTAGPCRRGVVLRDQARLSASDCCIINADIAVLVAGSGAVLDANRVTLHAGRINVRLPTAPHSSLRRVVTLIDSVLSGAKTGVQVMDAAADITLLRCSVAAAEAGVILTGPVTAEINGGSISGCQTGVMLGTLLRLDEDPCIVCGLSMQQARQAATASAAARGHAQGSGSGPTVAARCTHEGALAQLAMADCEVARCAFAGVHVSTLGRLEASRVTARECGHGFVMDVHDDLGSFESCRAIGCQAGVQDWRDETCAAFNPTSMPGTLPEKVFTAVSIPGVELLPI